MGEKQTSGTHWVNGYKNRKAEERFNTKVDKFRKAFITGQIAAEALKLGLYFAAWYDNLVIAPPLIITEDQVGEGMEIMDSHCKLRIERWSTPIPRDQGVPGGQHIRV
ncbi:MAG: hypothetical protein DDT29_00801 [Dehalococcoidia bacterium]|nr:hypothetical protein [Bacillota bacterium]